MPDNLTPITQTPSLLAGETFGLVVRATVPASANPGQTSDFDLTATSLGSQADGDVSTDQTATNTDAATVTTDGIIELQKDQTLQADADGNGVFSVGDTVRVNLTYSNTGIADASAVTISDTLPTLNAAGDAVELQYVAGSGSWTDAPGTVLTEDSTDTDASNAQGASRATHLIVCLRLTPCLMWFRPGALVRSALTILLWMRRVVNSSTLRA